MGQYLNSQKISHKTMDLWLLLDFWKSCTSRPALLHSNHGIDLLVPLNGAHTFHVTSLASIDGNLS